MTFDAYENVLAALAVWREARGEPIEAKQAVFWVIRNRRLDPRKRWPQTIAGVVLQPAQFSSFLASDPNAVLFPRPDDPSWRACCDAVDHPGPDPTGGANRYHSGPPPKWAENKLQTAQIGAFRFYRL